MAMCNLIYFIIVFRVNSFVKSLFFKRFMHPIIRISSIYKNLFSYIGDLNEENQPDGQGMLIQFKDKIVYDGYFKNGLFFGPGILQIQDGKYEGEFVNNHLHGQGVFTISENLWFEGNFRNDRKHGLFTISENSNKRQQYYQNDQEVTQAPDQSNSVPFAHLYESGQLTLSSDQLQTLDERQWLKSGVVDYYLGQVQLYCKKERYDMKAIKKFRKDQMNKKLLIPISVSQGIFGSQQSKSQFTMDITEKNKNDILNIIQKNQNNPQKKLRKLKDYDQIVMPLNLDRNHFILLVLEPSSKKLFQIDSIKQNNFKFFLKPIKKLFNFKYELGKRQLVQCFIEFVKLDVSEQPNGHDCGVYTSYNAQQIMKNHDNQIRVQTLYENGAFKFDHNEKIVPFRKHIRNVIEDNFEKLS